MIQESLLNFVPPVNGGILADMAKGYQESLVLYQGLKAGVFEILADSSRSAEEIAQEMQVVSQRAVLLLDALVSLELLEKKGERYFNSEVAQTFLCSGSEFYTGDLIELQLSPERRQQWGKIVNCLKEEKTGINRGSKPGDVFQPSFIRAMAQAAQSQKGFHETISLIAGHSCFRTAKQLLDLGGGHGLYSLALKQVKPELEVKVFDLPQVKSVMQEYSSNYGMEIAFKAGNFYEDQLPFKQDIILAFDICYNSPEQTERVLKKIYAALKPGGYLFTRHWFLDNSRTFPKRAAFFALQLGLSNPMSHVATLDEAKEKLINIGFQVEGSNLIGDSASTMLIARKGRNKNE